MALLKPLFFFSSLQKCLSFGTRSLHLSPLACLASPITQQSPVNESVEKAELLSKKYAQHVDDAISRWEKSNEVYYGKERDLKNFPPPRYLEEHPKVRLGFLPDSIFQPFYKHTGVTGPYLFYFGSIMFLISKEIWVVDPHFVEFVITIPIVVYLIKWLGPRCAQILDNRVMETEEKIFKKPMRQLFENLDNTIKTAEEEIDRATAVPLHLQAKEENLHLQLEVAYRDRLQQVYKTVQRRLDYHVERENARRRFQQLHMVDWIVNHVIQDITPAQEKETLSQCINELKRMAQASKMVPGMSS